MTRDEYKKIPVPEAEVMFHDDPAELVTYVTVKYDVLGAGGFKFIVSSDLIRHLLPTEDEHDKMKMEAQWRDLADSRAREIGMLQKALERDTETMDEQRQEIKRLREAVTYQEGRLAEAVAEAQALREEKHAAKPHVEVIREWLGNDIPGAGDIIDDLHRLIDIIDPPESRG